MKKRHWLITCIAAILIAALLVFVGSSGALRIAVRTPFSVATPEPSPSPIKAASYRDDVSWIASRDYARKLEELEYERMREAGGPCADEWKLRPRFAERVSFGHGGESAVIGDTESSRWDRRCLVHRGCDPVAAPPPCARGVRARTWAEQCASASALSLSGQIVSVRGVLGVDRVVTTAMLCMGQGSQRACCNGAHGSVVLGGEFGPLWLEGLRCGGDDSMVCCNAPAYGETVVAEGRLRRPTAADSIGGGNWVLADVKLCTPVD